MMHEAGLPTFNRKNSSRQLMGGDTLRLIRADVLVLLD